MIEKSQPLSSKDLSKGLVTRADILSNTPDQSPNCMDIKWYFDGAIGKRFGASTTNTIMLTSQGAVTGWIIDNNASLSTNLLHYWKMDETAGNRLDSIGTAHLVVTGTVVTVSGIRGNSVYTPVTSSSGNTWLLPIGDNGATSLASNQSNFTISFWIQVDTVGGTKPAISKGNEYTISFNGGGTGTFVFQVYDTSNGAPTTLVANTGAFLAASSFHSVIAWVSNGSHIGISVNNTVTTAPFLKTVSSGLSNCFLAQTDSGGYRLDEVGFWNKVLTSSERSDIYAGGSGNTFSTGTSTQDSWASYDFGASAIRWYTVAAGTGIIASSNGGTTFVSVTTSRSQTWQSFERSKNVLICTSDAYDQPLYWAGSVGTFAQALAPNSAPFVKFAVNYQGFLILLNSNLRKRGFFYADENLQLTDPWTSSFDIPSTADDEITAAFVLYRWLYISTRYKIYRVIFVGGNPDWQYLKVKDWGFVPRTVKLATIKGQQVAVGLDYSRRIRIFNGFDDYFVSDNVENNNNICDFSMKKISLAGSGLQMCHAEFDILEQEYRLNVAIGAGSTQTTHAIVLNGRTGALYPYANQLYNTISMAESSGIIRLLGVDRSGFVHILNSGNLDVSQSVKDIYDSPFLFKGNPEQVSKSRQINFFFAPDSCGTIYYKDRVDFSSVSSNFIPLKDNKGNTELTLSQSTYQIVRTVDIPSIQNIYQYTLTSSGNTANPWKMTHNDYLQEPRGYGRGV